MYYSGKCDCVKVCCATRHSTATSQTGNKCQGRRCVSLSWRCDGEKDCENGADEEECAAGSGFDRVLLSGGSGVQVPLRVPCDGLASRPGCVPSPSSLTPSVARLGSGLPRPRMGQAACAPEEFQCANRRCVAGTLHCDGDDDCGDGSDEATCTASATCGPHQFRCNSSECVPQLWSCDGDPDCADRSDEAVERCGRQAEPSHPRCSTSEFQCGSGECVRLAWKCDGDTDCKDKSDESKCPLLTCRPDEFQCGDGSCIHGTKQCNKVHDCSDSSDEAGCVNATKCEGPLKFMCKNGECIDSRKVCDSHRDCKDWSDEPAKECGLNECAINNGGCSHICMDRRIGYECECPAGYKLLDKKTCGDIDECSNPNACSQICINYKGDYKCECYEGYEMDPVTKTCKAEGKTPYLMFTNRHEIRRIDLVKRDYTQVIPTLKNVVALDVDVSANKMYWCDLAYINKASDSSQQVIIIDSALHSPGGLALDWVHKNLYWTDSRDKSISVTTVDGKKRRVLINTELSEPRAIAVDPKQGFMYWSDWGAQAKIEKAGLNGVDRQVLVSKSIAWPNGITLDLPNRRLYWVDSKLHLISSIDFNGANRKVLLSSTEQLGHPFALTVFEDRIYWTDLQSEAIYSANRLTGHDVATLAEHLNEPHDIVVVHELRQPKEPKKNYWSVSNGGCEYLCLKAPQITEQSPKYTCACPNGKELGPDMRKCVTAGPVLTTVLLTTSGVAMTSSAITASPIPIVATAVGGLLCVSGYLVWRNWRRRSTKSMNFDNPVYRKSAEGEDDEIHIGRAESLGHVYPPTSAPGQPFIALPLGSGPPDAGTHWYAGQPALTSAK
uniref:EGF-like domain-containing protein n=1 Tax=Scleropages formosus TaxID=113540 RepID=A0A8C9W1P5_SCLFO